ncbi:MAG: type II toxin-antitoxin system HicB family antitoxin [Ignavibacteriales bacterium]|nr:type II toxin-antitoxin system HicB family antitoxin [Ignavibacteriales bacterium]
MNKNNLRYYLSLDYPIHVDRMDDGQYCASIPLLKGCKGYAQTPAEAIDELAGVKEALFELLLEQGKPIPEPVVKLEIPLSQFSRFSNRQKLNQFIKV